MTSAKITRCKHYFHGVCLRKWLYVQDKCPLCHEVVISQDKQAAVPEPINPVEPINLNLNVDENRQTPNRSNAPPVELDAMLERALIFDGGNVRNSKVSDDSDSNESNYTSNSDETNLNFNSRSSPNRHFVNSFN